MTMPPSAFLWREGVWRTLPNLDCDLNSGVCILILSIWIMTSVALDESTINSVLSSFYALTFLFLSIQFLLCCSLISAQNSLLQILQTMDGIFLTLFSSNSSFHLLQISLLQLKIILSLSSSGKSLKIFQVSTIWKTQLLFFSLLQLRHTTLLLFIRLSSTQKFLNWI